MRRTLLAAALLPAGPALAQSAVQPLHPHDPPPAVEGIHLGDSLAQVTALLGLAEPDPLGEPPPGAPRTLRFRGGGLLVLADAGGSVIRIMLTRPEAGSIAGVRVGTGVDDILAVWGVPTQYTATTGRYLAPDWGIVLQAAEGTAIVARLMLARPGALPRLPPPP